MPIKQLHFTPLKAAAKVSDASSKTSKVSDASSNKSKVSDASSKISLDDVQDTEGGTGSHAEVKSPCRSGLMFFAFIKCTCADNRVWILQASSAASMAAAASMNINVFLRVRPLSQDYTGSKTLTVLDESSVALCAPPADPGQRDYKGDALAVNEKVELSGQDK